MLVKGKVEFVSYTGKYPNLCSGVLTLRIDGQEVKFGHDSADFDWKSSTYKDDNYEKFWSSGGRCSLRDGFGTAYQEEWRIDVGKLPTKFMVYAAEIDNVFNTKVPHGCCGGCL